MRVWPSRYNVVFRLHAPDQSPIYVLQNLFHGQVDFFGPPILPHLFEALEGSAVIELPEGTSSGFLARLLEKGYLYRSLDQEAKLVQRYVDTAGQRDAIIANQRGSQYGFLPTYACNLRCPYCFQRGLADKTRLMTEEMVDLAFSAIDELETGVQELQGALGKKAPAPGISIAGGEPLLASPRQRRVLERIIECSEVRGFRYSVTTNGVELEKFVDLFDRTSMITDIQVTMDGPPQIHNGRRILANGSGTFHQIQRGINAALAKRLPLSLRVNLDRANIDAVGELGAFILDSGWLDADNFHCYVSPVTDNSGSGGYEQIVDETSLLNKMLALFAANPRLARVFDIKHFRGFDYVRKLVVERQPKPPVLYRCEAVLGMYIFDPAGNIYVCLEAAGTPQLAVGSYVPRLQLSEARLEEWRIKDLVHLPACAECKVRFICAGGCALKAFGESPIPDCKPILEEMHRAWNHFEEEVVPKMCGVESAV
jgi:uncharacterized protein